MTDSIGWTQQDGQNSGFAKSGPITDIEMRGEAGRGSDALTPVQANRKVKSRNWVTDFTAVLCSDNATFVTSTHFLVGGAQSMG